MTKEKKIEIAFELIRDAANDHAMYQHWHWISHPEYVNTEIKSIKLTDENIRIQYETEYRGDSRTWTLTMDRPNLINPA